MSKILEADFEQLPATAQEIRDLRSISCMSVKEFAHHMRVHFTTIYHWESGHKRPSDKQIHRARWVADALEIA